MLNPLGLFSLQVACQLLAPKHSSSPIDGVIITAESPESYTNVNEGAQQYTAMTLDPLVLSLQLTCQVLASRNSSSLINFANVGPPSRKSAAELPEGYTAFRDIGVAYKYHRIRRSWNEARKYCETEGGNLAVIDSSKKIEYLGNAGWDGDQAWVGVHRFFGDGEWTSVKGGSLGTTLPWRSVSFISDIADRCIAVTGAPDVGVYVERCVYTGPFICEVSIFRD